MSIASYIARHVHDKVFEALESSLDEPPRTWVYEALVAFVEGISVYHETGYPCDAEQDAAFHAAVKDSMREFLGDD